jgi:hypothetical protein
MPRGINILSLADQFRYCILQDKEKKKKKKSSYPAKKRYEDAMEEKERMGWDGMGWRKKKKEGK